VDDLVSGEVEHIDVEPERSGMGYDGRMQRSGALASVACLAWLAMGCARPTTGAAPTASTTTETPRAAPLTPEPVANAPDASASEAPAPSADATAPPSDAPAAPLESCGLTATLRRAPNGSFGLVLKNGGPSTLRLVLPGDGSEAGWRTPTLTWTATSGGKPVSREGEARCGLTNPIEAKELFSLAPGAERQITEWIPPPPFPRGTYELRLTYRNDPRLAGGKVTVTEEAKRGLEESSACEVTTAPLRAKLP
jgi:hypothetical protein